MTSNRRASSVDDQRDRTAPTNADMVVSSWSGHSCSASMIGRHAPPAEDEFADTENRADLYALADIVRLLRHVLVGQHNPALSGRGEGTSYFPARSSRTPRRRPGGPIANCATCQQIFRLRVFGQTDHVGAFHPQSLHCRVALRKLRRVRPRELALHQ
jgi:hypothetical protein